MTAPNTLGNTAFARTPEQIAHYQATIGKGVCPFCKPDPTINKIIRTGTFWRVWPNPFAYTHNAHHIIFATIEHVTDIATLDPAVFAAMMAELATLAQSVINEFGIEGGALVMRFGDMRLNAGTLHHLHAHIQVPDGTGPAFAVFNKLDSAHAENQLELLRKAFTPPV